jgi:carbon storage regulator
MLVLTRKIGESLVLPSHTVVVTVLEVTGGRVKLGLVAPPDVPIRRAESLHRPAEKELAEKVVKVS